MAEQQAAVAALPLVESAGAGWPATILPFQLIVVPGRPPLVLAQDRDLVTAHIANDDRPGTPRTVSQEWTADEIADVDR